VTVLLVRREGPGDVGPIRDVHRAAFGGGEPVEAGLVDALRADAGWLPHLSLVAVRDGGWSGTSSRRGRGSATCRRSVWGHSA